MMVSILIPLYNKEEWIVETLESALAQIYASCEIIVLDDGSTDASLEVASRYQKHGVAVHSQANRGASATRNRLTELARGDCLQYLDADDLLTPESIQLKVEALQMSGADVAYGNWQRLVASDEGGWISGRLEAQTMADIHPDPALACFSKFWCPPVALLYSRAAVEKTGGWNERLPIIQDARFLQDAALSGAQFCRVDALLGYYRDHEIGSLGKPGEVKFYQDVFKNTVEVADRLQVENRLSSEWQEVLMDNYECCLRAFSPGDPEGFSQALGRVKFSREKKLSRFTRCSCKLAHWLGDEQSCRMMGMLRRYFSK